MPNVLSRHIPVVFIIVCLWCFATTGDTQLRTTGSTIEEVAIHSSEGELLANIEDIKDGKSIIEHIQVTDDSNDIYVSRHSCYMP